MIRYSAFMLLVLWFAAPAYAEDLTSVRLIGCYDGDTCSFDILMPAVLSSALGVRLLGIDTPEIKGKCQREKDLALAARALLVSSLLYKQVTLKDVTRDKYFRIDAIVLADGENVNQKMVNAGLAVPYNGTGPRHNWCQ